MNSKVLIALFFLIVAMSCNNSRNEQNMSKENASYTLNQEVKDFAGPPPPPPPPSTQANENSSVDKKIIKTAYINIEVVNIVASRKLIDTTIKTFNGNIVSENMQNTESQLSSNINIKVPALQFDKMLAKLATLAKKVDYQNIETQDVTAEYIDVETRLSNGKKVEQTYIKLLQRANTIEDILKIEQKLGEIRTEIESTQGRLKYINNQVSYSTINLSIYQKLEYKFIAEQLPSFWERLKGSIISGWRGIVTFILFLINLWPLWILAALGWYAWKRIRESKTWKKKKEKKERKQEKRQKKNSKINEITQ